jgi:hypothetical protein
MRGGPGRLLGLALAVMLTRLVGQAQVFGGEAGDAVEPSPVEGTWHVTVRFPESSCTARWPLENF